MSVVVFSINSDKKLNARKYVVTVVISCISSLETTLANSGGPLAGKFTILYRICI